MSNSPSNQSGHDYVATTALTVAMLLWGTSFAAIKIALDGYQPIVMTFGRMTIGFVTLLPFSVHWKKKVEYKRGDWKIFLLLVLSEPCLYFLFETYALRYTTASEAGLVTSLLPLLVAISAWFVFKERLGLMAWIGFFLALAGVIWLTLAGVGVEQESAPNSLLGNSLEFCAMVAATSYTLCVRRLSNYPAFLIAAVQAFGGMCFFGILLFVFPSHLPENFPLAPTLATVYLGVVITTGAYGLFNVGIARLGAGRGAAWTNLLPVSTLFFSFLYLGERLTRWQYVAIIPILAGVVLSQITPKRSKKNPGSGPSQAPARISE